MSVNSDSKASQTGANPEAATHIYRHADAIVEAWTRMVRDHCDDARASMDTDYLQNALPTLLRHLADALEDPDWNYDKARASSLSAEHGRQRHISSEYTVEMMLDEYAILRKVICRSLERQPPWPDAVLARVHAFIDASLCAATRELFSWRVRDVAETWAAQRNSAKRECKAAEQQLQITTQQKEASEQRATDAETELVTAQHERDVGRSDVAELLEAGEMRERVVALVSHDLRSPLFSITLSLQRIKKNPGNIALANRLISGALRAARRADQMLQDMLDVGRLRAGHKLPVVFASCDIAQLAAEAHEDYVAMYGPRVELKTPKTAVGTWDGPALRRVVDNLVGNAVKYGAPEAGISIAVQDAAEAVTVTVHNYGPPLHAKELATLFEAYARTDAAKRGKQGGWGLGLTLVQGVVQAHSGRVGATSTSEAGTTFWFELPKNPEAALVAARQ